MPKVVRLVEPANGEAPMVLYETVSAVEPLKLVPEATPEPLLLNVKAAVVLAVTVIEPPKLTFVPLIVMELLAK